MLAQIGFTPVFMLWFVAVGYLVLLALCGIFVACVRAWHLWSETQHEDRQ